MARETFVHSPIPNSQFPIPNSQFPIPNSQFPIPNSYFFQLFKVYFQYSFPVFSASPVLLVHLDLFSWLF
ncbi:MAG: hypothetical protein F6K31_28905 [Symploca sp. SIO2G7]|nr:hypothetical protein [Symploca sp. SIO2G7]